MVYWIAKAYRRQGIGTDAEKALIHYLFNYYNQCIGLVTHMAKKENIASQKSPPRIGMKQTTRPHDTWAYEGEKEETITWVLTQQQWSKLYGQEKPIDRFV